MPPEETLVLPTDKRQSFMLLVLSALFLGMSWPMIAHGHASLKESVTALMPCIGILVAFLTLLPNSSCLMLTPDGFRVRKLFREKGAYRWQDIQGFDTANVGITQMVVFNFAPEYTRQATDRLLTRTITGYEGAITNQYMRHATDLSALLNQWHGRYVKPGAKTPVTS